jgi:uncharacterized membrane protein YfcA
MLGPGWTEPAALVAAFAIAVAATPAGISGAVLLLPFQVSVLGTPSPAVTPTNLLYNVVATPGALYRYWRQGQTGGRLAFMLISGTLPGVIAGSVIRVELLPGPRVFDLLVCAVLLPLGIWLVATRAASGRQARPLRLASTWATSVAGVVTFTILSTHQRGAIAPAWATGVALGIGGLAGSYTGARIQGRLPEALIRRVVGALVIVIGARYLWSGLS